MIKRRVLLAIQKVEPAETAADLVTLVGEGPHAITHILWRLQKEGLITFQTGQRKAKREMPFNIRLTEKGRSALDRE